MFRLILIVLASSGIALMLFDGPKGRLLTSNPDRGPVARQSPGHRQGGGSVRRHGGGFFIFSGGYHGGK